MNERVIYTPKGEHKVPRPDSIQVEKPSTKQLPDFKQTLAQMQQIQEIERNLELWQKELEIQFTVGGQPWLPIMALGDFHLGSFDTDMNSLSRHLDFARDHNVRIMLLGDLADMFLPGKIPEGAQADTSINMQLHLLRQFFIEYQDLILACVSDPSHVDWTRQIAGIDTYRWLTNDLNIPLLETGGLLKMGVNDQQYNWSLWHKVGQYNSSLNPTHVHKRVVDRHSADELDFVVTGHTHKGATEINKTIRGKKRGLVQLGTFKTLGGQDKYARKGFVGGVNQHFPLFLLRADQHDFEIIDNLNSADMILDGLDLYNQQYAQGMLGL